jgi:hypothetical protein
MFGIFLWRVVSCGRLVTEWTSYGAAAHTERACLAAWLPEVRLEMKGPRTR